jgi:predicted permease
VLTQCSFRSNYAIIGIPLALSLGGEEAVAFASVLSAVAVPVFNILAVIILSHYSGERENRSRAESGQQHSGELHSQ